MTILHKDPTHRTVKRRLLLLIASCCLLITPACKSGDRGKQDVSLLPGEDDTAMLEEPVRTRTASMAPGEDEAIFIPMANKEMSLAIDGDSSDWRDLSMRAYEGKDAVVDGKRDWDGKRDASMKIGAHVDTNYLYLLVSVRDDVVLDEGQDAVDIWLRDPRLEEITQALPQGVSIEDDLISDIALHILPDGTTTLTQQGLTLPPESVTIATSRQDGEGWTIEAAISLEAMPFVAGLPLTELAFRVDLLDGDKKSADEPQTSLSMLPAEEGDRPRFAIISAPNGLSPHRDARGAVARADGVGYWKREATAWSFHNIEAIPRTWKTMPDASALLTDAETPFACASRDQELLTLEAYTTRSTRHRIGLVLCSARTARGGSCPKDAQTELFWVHLARNERDTYELRRQIPVFDKPLAQCRTRAAGDGILYDHFATLPLDFVNANMWTVSWRERHEDTRYAYTRHAMRLLSAKSGALMGGEHTMMLREDRGQERVEMVNMSYFIEVDDVEGYDICEVERHLEQDCESYQRGCKTRAHGASVMTHIKLWEPQEEVFKSYALRHHKGCPVKFDLSQREGYLLFHTGTRVGLIPSGLNKDD